MSAALVRSMQTARSIAPTLPALGSIYIVCTRRSVPSALLRVGRHTPALARERLMETA